MNFSWSENERKFRETLREFIRDNLREDWSHFDRMMPTSKVEEESREFCRSLADGELLVPHWPVRFGGRDASAWEQVVLSEEMWRAGEPRAGQYPHVNWIGPAIMKLGSEEQKQYHLEKIRRADVIWCQGFSEPDAGSDLASLRTRAVRDGDVYIVNGQKVWTSYAQGADFCFLLARTRPEGPGQKSISIFLVPMTLEGITVRGIPAFGVEHMLNEVTFEDVRVPVSCLLGNENEGWNFVKEILSHERIGNANYEWIDRMVDVLVDSCEAESDAPRAASLEVVGRLAAQAAAGRVLSHVAVDAVVRGAADRDALASTSRAQVAYMERGAAEAFTDLIGPEALVQDHHGDYQQLSSLAQTLGGGSLEMQLNNIARLALGLSKG